MNGAGFILAINVSVAGFLAAAFLALALFDRARLEARWFALGYVLGMVYFALEFAIRWSDGAALFGVAASTAFLLSLAAFTAGIARLYEKRVPWRAIGIILAVSMMVRLGIEGMPRDEFLRQFLYQAPFTVMQGLGVVVVARRAWRRSVMDRLLLVLVSVTAAHYSAKPFLAMAAGGVGDTAGAYMGTLYAMFSQASGAILFVGMALLLFVVLVREAMATIRVESVTDKLSGLFNRRGFEERREAALRERSVNGLPLSIVLADLDHFKLVNDSHGHASGDLVIMAFSTLLRNMVSPHHVVGRIGGEEFAIMLPGANLGAARLFAENARQAFSAMAVEGFPDHARFSASFGVAEARHGESSLELQARADNALYEAKRAGRDCVRVSSPPHIVLRTSRQA